MESHLKVIYNYIANHVSIKEDVKDIVQETMLSIWMSLKGFDKRSSFRSWAISITKRRIADYYRSRYKSQSEPIDEYEGVLVDEEDGFGRIEDSLLVDKVLDALDASDREILFLVFYAQLTYNEVAEIMKVPVGTIKSRMSRLRSNLGRYFQEGNHE